MRTSSKPYKTLKLKAADGALLSQTQRVIHTKFANLCLVCDQYISIDDHFCRHCGTINAQNTKCNFENCTNHAIRMLSGFTSIYTQ